jgi:hypothetical protein
MPPKLEHNRPVPSKMDATIYRTRDVQGKRTRLAPDERATSSAKQPYHVAELSGARIPQTL